ncbi:MAG: hypothetical protein ACFCD0_10480 [Gemmataceae bacterium]
MPIQMLGEAVVHTGSVIQSILISPMFLIVLAAFVVGMMIVAIIHPAKESQKQLAPNPRLSAGAFLCQSDNGSVFLRRS